jgi:hypothetical protein
VHEHLGRDVAVGVLLGRLFDGDRLLGAVDENDDISGGLALDLERVVAAELQQRAEVAADVAVDRDARERRQRDDQRLARPGVGSVSGQRPRADDDVVLRRPKPRPPMKISFISGVTAFSDTVRVERSICSVRFV